MDSILHRDVLGSVNDGREKLDQSNCQGTINSTLPMDCYAATENRQQGRMHRTQSGLYAVYNCVENIAIFFLKKY